MPPRGTAPGLKRGRHGLPYWIARQVVRDPMGFPDSCIPLPPAADEAALAELCREHTARLRAWIEQHSNAPGPQVSARYDGTVASLCRLYQQHPDSPFHEVKHNTRKTYGDSLKVIEQSVGARIVRNVTTLDVRRWYKNWRQPAQRRDGDGNEIVGRERIDRAHDAVSMVKTVLRFGFALGRAECGALAERIAMLRFEKGGAREQEMTFAQASAFIAKALELGKNGIVPAIRARYMAIGVAAQFETALRQKDIIGERHASEAECLKANPKALPLDYGAFWWTGFFTWENVPGWVWRPRTSKSKYRASIRHDLSCYGLLFPLLEAVPQDERRGAIVKDETLRPVREGSYRTWFRQIARAAGIPDEVWNMDSRAGAATEAEEAGAAFEAIQAVLTHSSRQEATTLRYIRRRERQVASVAQARKRAREESGTP